MSYKKRSILFLSTMNGDPWGGSEEAWYRMALHLASQGHQVHCAFYGWPSGKEDKVAKLKAAGCNITQFTNPKTATSFLSKLHKRIMLQNETIRLIKEHAFDLAIISQGGFLDVTYPPFHRTLPFLKKFVVISHNYNENDKLKSNRKAKLQQWVKAASLNMADSARALAAIKNIGGFDIPNQLVMINPLMIAISKEPVPWPMLKDNCYIMIVMAQLDTSRKAQDILIKTLSLNKWKERNWQLLLYGKGSDQKMLEMLVEQYELNDKIFFRGHTADTAAAYKQAHIVLQITHIDSMPLSVTEAMSMAKPCIVSAAGDMPVWIEDGVNGYIAKEVTEKGIDEVLERAWQQRENWKLAGENAYKTFMEKYPQPYEGLYENIFLRIPANQ